MPQLILVSLPALVTTDRDSAVASSILVPGIGLAAVFLVVVIIIARNLFGRKPKTRLEQISWLIAAVAVIVLVGLIVAGLDSK